MAGLQQQLVAALDRSKAASGCSSSIQAVEEDIAYADLLLEKCTKKPAGVLVALTKALNALNMQTIVLQ
jgi:hypothetical protein